MASQPSREVTGQLPALRELMRSMPPELRPAVNSFWSNIRSALTAQEVEIQELRQSLADLRLVTVPPARPASSASVIGIRTAIDQALAESAVPELSDEKFRIMVELPPD